MVVTLALSAIGNHIMIMNVNVNIMNSDQEGDECLTCNNTIHFKNESGRHKKCIYFNHIQKCGGSSMRKRLVMLARQLNWTMTMWYEQKRTGMYGEMHPLPNITYNRDAIHAGHRLPQRFIPDARLEDCIRFTVLRDPVDRVSSLFHFVSNKDWDKCLFGSLETNTCKFAGGHRDWMIQMLSNGNPQICGSRRFCAIENKDTALQLSMELLLDYDLVCFIDDMDTCIGKLHQLLGVEDTSQQVLHTNVGKDREKSESQITMNKIRTVNSYDIELYAWALAQFRS